MNRKCTPTVYLCRHFTDRAGSSHRPKMHLPHDEAGAFFYGEKRSGFSSEQPGIFPLSPQFCSLLFTDAGPGP